MVEQILYVSSLSSEAFINELYHKTNKNPGFAAQKFHRLLAKGINNNGLKVKCLIAAPLTREHSKRPLFTHKKEIENGLTYIYVPFINTNQLRKMCLLFYSFIYTLIWGIKYKTNGAVICDVLNVSVSIGAAYASKLVGIKCCGLFTDLPGMSMGENGDATMSFSDSRYLHQFTHYVFLTEYMNNKVNSNNLPYVVIEGVSDIESSNINYYSEMQSSNEKIVLYAGALYERYGLKTLVEAFMRIDDPNARLHLFGSGPFENEIVRCSINDSRICFMGVRPTEEVVRAEKQATLLVNPRPAKEEFTKYSFPSKNIEYMSTGTPLLTTKLPGIPIEYYPFVYFIEDESVDGYFESINSVLSLTRDDLIKKGSGARDFVINNKNNNIQARRLIALLNNK